MVVLYFLIAWYFVGMIMIGYYLAKYLKLHKNDMSTFMFVVMFCFGLVGWIVPFLVGWFTTEEVR